MSLSKLVIITHLFTCHPSSLAFIVYLNKYSKIQKMEVSSIIFKKCQIWLNIPASPTAVVEKKWVISRPPQPHRTMSVNRHLNQPHTNQNPGNKSSKSYRYQSKTWNSIETQSKTQAAAGGASTSAKHPTTSWPVAPNVFASVCFSRSDRTNRPPRGTWSNFPGTVFMTG